MRGPQEPLVVMPYCELPVKLTLDDTNDVFSRFSAYFEQ